MVEGGSEWPEYQRLVMTLLEDNRNRTDELQKELNAVRREDIGGIKTDLALLKMKVALIAGGVSLVAQAAIPFLFKLFKEYL